MRNADGQPQVGGSYVTLRRVGLWEQAVLWASVAFGAMAMLALWPRALWQLRRHGLRSASARVPAAWALLAMGAALAAWALQGWQHLAEFTPVTAAVALGSLILPLACGAQCVHAWRHRQGGGGAGWDALLALAGLQLSALLAAFGWLPLLPWRL